MSEPTLPREFESWEQCRDFFALEAIFLGQLFDRRSGPRNKKRYMDAAKKAVAANKQCTKPLPMEDPDE
jgi:hypothetical protein